MPSLSILFAFSAWIVQGLGDDLTLLQLPPTTSARRSRLVWIGNSYTFNPGVHVPVPEMFASLSAEAGNPVDVEYDKGGRVTGGTTLYQHADASHSAGKQTLKWLQDPAGWDYVILQDHSLLPGGGLRVDDISQQTVNLWKAQSMDALSDFFVPQLSRLHAKAVLYSSWGRRDEDNNQIFPDFETMTAKTTRGYMDYSEVLSSKMKSKPILASVGRAMQWAKGRYGNLFEGLFQSDSSRHPTQAGAYLIACVFFASIWKKSPEGLAYSPSEIKDADKLTLQKIAAHAVFDHGLPLTTSKYTGGTDGRISWSKSDATTALQTMLNAQGYSCTVDAYLGSKTIRRLQEFLVVVAGEHLDSSAFDGSLDRSTVEGLQRYFTRHNITLKNGIDGHFGSNTIKALQTFLANLPTSK